MIPARPYRAVDLIVIDPQHTEDAAPATTKPQLSEKD